MLIPVRPGVWIDTVTRKRGDGKKASADEAAWLDGVLAASAERDAARDTRQALAAGIATIEAALGQAAIARQAATARQAVAHEAATQLAARGALVQTVPNPTPAQLRDELVQVYARLAQIAEFVSTMSDADRLAADGIAAAYEALIGLAHLANR